MAQFVQVPTQRLQAEVLEALLEEFASRDGTDYGFEETPLHTRVQSLLRKINAGDLLLLFEQDSEEWDLLPRDEAELLLDS